MGWQVGIGTVLGGISVAIVLGAPREARACSCGGSSTLVAPVAAEHPAGAPLVFGSGCGGSLESWSATIDGLPAALVGTGDGIHRVAIDPAPPQGALVVLSVDCSEAFFEPDCTDPEAVIERARFVIGPPDTSAPPPVDAVTLEQEDGAFDIGCFEDTVDLRLGAIVEVGTREPGTWVEVRFLRDGVEIQGNSHTIPENGVVESSHYVDRSELAGSETCVSVAVLDAAGNAAAAEEDCEQFAGEGCGCATEPAALDAALAFGVLVLVRRQRRR